MFAYFFTGLQQDFKIFLLAPLFCAIFRLCFIWVYGPEKLPHSGTWKKWRECFRYGFWWGMDWNAYVFLLSLALVSLPGAFLPAYFAIGDTVRAAGVTLYLVLLYTAFMGKLIFYFHFHDIFNQTLRLGRNADKMNFVDIFFHQNHGAWILLGYIPFAMTAYYLASSLLALPVLDYGVLGAWLDGNAVLRYALNTVIFLASIALFYWLRYGGTFKHGLKPEWDEVPPVVKEDVFMAKATLDDLVALELVYKYPINEMLKHSDEESAEIMLPLFGEKISSGEKPWLRFKRRAQGARLKKPGHIFFLFGESHTQQPLDPEWESLHLMAATEKWRQLPGTTVINNFLPAGRISQPSLTSVLAGIYDCNLELNENKDFWYGRVPTSLALQMRSLGYRTEFWYGGGLNWGSLEHFVPALGFDAWHGGPEICAKDAPRTWLGIHDHLFLEAVAELVEREEATQPVFHFVYTTSNHGPYHMPFEQYGYRKEEALAAAPDYYLHLTGHEERLMAGVRYTDKALMDFAERMRENYPDSLFVVTGDHAGGLASVEHGEKSGLLTRNSLLLRENIMPSFSLHHPDLKPEMLAGNTLGGHMHILPTLMELIAPAGFEYLSMMPPLTEKIDHVVTPYAWLTEDRIGDYDQKTSQQSAPSAQPVPLKQDDVRFAEERAALMEVTGWLVRHPELLEDAGRGRRV